MPSVQSVGRAIIIHIAKDRDKIAALDTRVSGQIALLSIVKKVRYKTAVGALSQNKRAEAAYFSLLW